jgi:segregation and condensation protein A
MNTALDTQVATQQTFTIPDDLYIPPQAMQVFLEIFSGPLDLLLYLIRKNNIDILDIPVAEITRQYMNYIAMMQTMQLDLAGEYLEMAAILAEIKSRMLLPKIANAENEEVDPRAELVRRLQEYEVIKQAAAQLDLIPRAERDFHVCQLPATPPPKKIQHPTVTLHEVLLALQQVLAQAQLHTVHHITTEVLSVRERMTNILAQLNADTFVELHLFFQVKEGRLGIIVTFLAILELAKESMLEIVQAHQFAPIYVRLFATC